MVDTISAINVYSDNNLLNPNCIIEYTQTNFKAVDIIKSAYASNKSTMSKYDATIVSLKNNGFSHKDDFYVNGGFFLDSYYLNQSKLSDFNTGSHALMGSRFVFKIPNKSDTKSLKIEVKLKNGWTKMVSL